MRLRIFKRERGIIKNWFEEKFPVKSGHGATPQFDMERAAISLFGLPAFGVHLNGFVGRGKDMKMWVAERAHDKPIEPGKYDQIVAGGQPADLSIEENLAKECEEEAHIDAETVAKAVAVSAITYMMERPEGLRCDILYNYDLELDPSFTPVNTDGEVHSFHLWPLEQVRDVVHDTDDFKFNCSLVVIDFLIRHGVITPEHPEYVDCVKGLRS
jgi:8-oxo-dGTP pyrophosphatase MutT (NUDIX family)